MLASISLYWFTGAIGSSFWPSYGRLHAAWPISPAQPITVPTGYAAFPKEIIVPPRSIAEKTYTNIQRWTEMEKGGHFAAMEQRNRLSKVRVDALLSTSSRRVGIGANQSWRAGNDHIERHQACL
jgi:hypothetical protein